MGQKSRRMSQPLVIFIHGLNTFGDDQFHAGPLVFGPMHQFWKPRLEALGFDFHSLDKMGFGPFEDQVDRAVEQIERILSKRSLEANRNVQVKTSVHLFGHSMGGLVARGVAAKLGSNPAFLAFARLCSVMTLGSPHKGTNATEDALDLSKQSPRLYRILKIFGYDLEERRDAIQFFTIERVREFSDRHPPLENVECVSFIGAVRKDRLALPFRLIYNKLHPVDSSSDDASTGPSDGLSDGLITAHSQEWARIGGVFELDHFSELGAFVQIGLGARSRAKREFDRLVSSVQKVIVSTS